MYYELYIDVFFLVNFMMDYLILSLLNRMLRCSATHGRICVGSLLGAGLTCIFIVLPIPGAFIKFILFHSVVNVVMIYTGLKIRTFRAFLRGLVFLYISSFLLGGVMMYFRQYIRYGSLFFAIAVGSYWICIGIWKLLCCLVRQDSFRCQVILRVQQKEIKVNALIDTGNTLQDSVTGQPVSILDKAVAGRLFGEIPVECVRYIPYHSIGREHGVMQLVRLDSIEILKREKKVINHPYVAVSEETISDDDYKMILNPDIL